MLDDVLIEEVDMITDGDDAKHTWTTRELVDQNFTLDESTQSIVISVALDPASWRGIQRDCGTSDVFKLDIPFGGQHINFVLKGDEESPVLKGKLGGCVWRKGAKWYVEQRQGKPTLEVFLPKQTP